jgi:mono/diheme cytochrome c family protein
MRRFFLFGVGLLTVVGRALLATEEPSADSAMMSKLTFDAMSKQYDAKLSDKTAAFNFWLTNTSTREITVDRVETSCGCTVATLPANPWHLAPGAHGKVDATVNLDGKGAGLISKTLTFSISCNGNYLGTRVATVKVNVPTVPAPAELSAEERQAAMERAKADPQEIFKNRSCAKCHVDQGVHQWGSRLYAADCGICHDSPNRASFVPDLHSLKIATDFSYWKSIIANGKPHTLMPGFADTAGGPLNDDQVHSLAEYLSRNFPGRPGS